MQDDGLPPHNLPAERAVLGCAILEGARAAEAVVVHLGEPDFYLGRHRLVWAALRALVAGAHHVDLVTVCTVLRDSHQLEEAGGPAYLAELVEQAVVGPALLPTYLPLLRAETAKRELAGLMGRSTTALQAGEDLGALLAQLRAGLDQAERRVAPAAGPLLESLPELFAHPPPEPGWLVEGVLQAQANGWLAAGAKVGKSFMALDLLLSLAFGTPWLGHFPVPRPVRTILIEEEDSRWRVYSRLDRLLRGRADATGTWPGLPETFAFSIRKGVRLDDPPGLARLLDEVRVFRPDLIVWDVFRTLHLQDERRPDQIMPVLWQLDRLRDLLRCANLLAHHQRKQAVTGPDLAQGGMKLRGPSEFWGWAENSLYLTPLKGKGVVVVEPESKDAILQPFKAHLEETSNGGCRWVYDGIAQARGEKVADRLALIQKALADGPLSASAIRQRLVPHLGTDTPKDRTIERDLRVLLEAGVVRREGGSRNTVWSLATPETEEPPF